MAISQGNKILASDVAAEIAKLNSRISNIESKMQYVEAKVYSSWEGSASERTNGNIYKALPSGVSNVKKVEFYFNETPYMQYRSHSPWDCTNVSAKDTVVLSPGSSITMSNPRNGWIMGVETDGRPYMYLYDKEDLGGADAYWNIALTFYM